MIDLLEEIVSLVALVLLKMNVTVMFWQSA